MVYLLRITGVTLDSHLIPNQVQITFFYIQGISWPGSPALSLQECTSVTYIYMYIHIKHSYTCSILNIYDYVILFRYHRY